VPESASGCPNCAVSPRGALTKLIVTVGSLVVVSGCILATPAYGITVQCDQPQIDGGAQGCPGDCDTVLPDGGAWKDDPSSGCGGAP